MLDSEYRLLRHIRAGLSLSPSRLAPDDRAVFRSLAAKKLIRQEWETGRWIITDVGRVALLEAEQDRQRRRQDEIHAQQSQRHAQQLSQAIRSIDQRQQHGGNAFTGHALDAVFGLLSSGLKKFVEKFFGIE